MQRQCLHAVTPSACISWGVTLMLLCLSAAIFAADAVALCVRFAVKTASPGFYTAFPCSCAEDAADRKHRVPDGR
eukprot:3937208-Rhodomonas_salina.16